jgi:hypothetical protein
VYLTVNRDSRRSTSPPLQQPRSIGCRAFCRHCCAALQKRGACRTKDQYNQETRRSEAAGGRRVREPCSISKCSKTPIVRGQRPCSTHESIRPATRAQEHQGPGQAKDVSTWLREKTHQRPCERVLRVFVCAVKSRHKSQS